MRLPETPHGGTRTEMRSALSALLISVLALSLGAATLTPPPRPVNPKADIGATTKILNPGVVSWVHFGDLHITSGGEQNYADFQSIIRNTNQYLLNGVNFAVLPGDNANEGTEEEYQLIQQAAEQLRVPLYAVPGDHDARAGLDLFTRYLEPVPYQSFTADRYHFVFINALDGGGRGGFGIGPRQLDWLTKDLGAASQRGLHSVLFMHAFPSKLNESGPPIQTSIQNNRVLMVDVGHTHYNHIANDGHTIYAATRSTGQAHEGPVGFSIANLDHGVVSWKFKPLGNWPFVMITSPADKQLITDAAQPDQVVRGMIEVRAKIWDDKGVAAATYQIDNETERPLMRIGNSQMWSARWNSELVSDGDHQISVNVRGAGGNTNQDKVYVFVNQSGIYQVPPRQPGDQGNSIGAYAEKGLLGTVGGGPGGGKKEKGGPKGPPRLK